MKILRKERKQMPVNDELGKRMKEYYENIPKTKLMRRTPVMLRLDGKAFHSWTRGFKRPFDEVLVKSMQDTTKYLCENIMGCVLGYTQSDEITLVLIDYQKHTSQAFFDYEVQKLCSIIASMATMAFNKAFLDNVDIAYHEEFYKLGLDNVNNFKSKEEYNEIADDLEKKYDIYYNKVGTAMFDCRCFNIPKEEVTNCIYWRQLDATRNSIQMVGQANFSHTELHKKNKNDIQDMLMLQKGINWNDFPTHLKRGSCCIKETYYHDSVPRCEDCPVDATTARTRWIVDKEIPIFKGEGRTYIDKLVFVGE